MGPPRMKVLILIIVAVGAATFFLALMKVRSTPDSGEKGSSADCELFGSVLSPAERHFLGILAAQLPAGVGVLVKVRLADIFAPRRGLDATRRRESADRLRAQSVDFLLVRAENFSPLAGIAFREDSRRGEGPAKQGYFVENAFARNGLAFLTVTAQPDYDAAELRRRLAALLSKYAAHS